MAKVLVTGGTGFIGSHLVERLLREGRDVRVLALKNPLEDIENENLEIIKTAGAEIIFGDLLDKESLVSALDGVDTVFHLGGISRPMNILSSVYYDSNVLGTRNLLEVAKVKSLKRFIHTSSVSVLGVSPDGVPLKEDDFQYESLEYGLSKREGEKVALDFYYKNNVPVVVIRPCLVYGPRCMVRAVMFKCVKYGIFPLFKGGQAKMEFAYVDNIVEAMMLAETKDGVLGESFNITDGRSYQVIEVIKTIAKELSAPKPLLRLPVWLGFLLGHLVEFVSKIIGIYPPFSKTATDWMSNNRNVYSCEKAKEVLGYEPQVSLEEGIKRSISWYKEKGIL